MKAPVTSMFKTDIGIKYFHANACSWSSLKRGYVNRAQNIKNAINIILANKTKGPRNFIYGASNGTPGIDHPPKNNVALIAAKAKAVPNSPMKKNRNQAKDPFQCSWV